MKSIIKFRRPAAAAFGAAVLMGAGSAYAADAILEAPPSPPEVTYQEPAPTGWAGPYVGIQGGYVFGETDALPGVGSRDHDGWSGGAFAGVQGQSGNVVYGVEGDVGYNGADGTGGGITTNSGMEGSLRARLGYAPNDRILLYGTAGGAAEKLEATDGGVADSNTMLGYTVGAGAEAKLTENVFGRLEYRYTDYGSDTFNLGGGAQSIDSTSNRVNVGVGFKF